MQNLNYNNSKLSLGESRMFSLKIKLIKNISATVSFIMSALWVIAIIEFIRFCFDLYSYLH